MTNVKRKLIGAALGGTLALMLILVSYDIVTPDVGHAAGTTQTMLAQQGGSGDQQTTTGAPSSAKDQKVPVQVWTIMAAGVAAAIFLLLFFVRIALGRVSLPPPQEDAHH